MSSADTATLDVKGVQKIIDRLEGLEGRVADLQTENEEFRNELEVEREQRQKLEAHVDALEEENERLRHRYDAKTDFNSSRVAELQSREIEKGAHLLKENVEPLELEIEGDRLEKITKDEGQEYVRLPNEEDPLGRGGSTKLAHGDLLPIQQLARLDGDMLATQSRPVQLAVKAWQNRDDVGNYGLWSKGSGSIELYLNSSDLANEIRSWEMGVSKEYAQKLATRTMDALKRLSKDRVYVTKRQRRKDGLQYRENRLILPRDAELPGENRPQTDGVASE